MAGIGIRNHRQKEVFAEEVFEVFDPPGEMFFFYFQSLLKSFPSHQKRTKWQHEQMKALITNLPPNHVCCVHD